MSLAIYTPPAEKPKIEQVGPCRPDMALSSRFLPPHWPASLPTATQIGLSLSAQGQEFVLMEPETIEEIAARFRANQQERASEMFYVDADIPTTYEGACW